MAKKKNRLPEATNKLVQNFHPRNKSQKELIKSIEDNEVTIAVGPAGTGKTICSLAAALNLLGITYKKIVLIKSVTTLPSEELGFLKGSLHDKMEPFMFSFKWNVDKLCGKGAFENLVSKDLIEILPLAFIRGITLDDSIVILDESQNFSSHIFKSIMSRIGENSKYIFLGDIEQIDLRKKEESFLRPMLDIFSEADYVGTIEFTDEDCVRNPIIPKILKTLRDNGY